MRIENVTGWLFRLIPERVFDALSGSYAQKWMVLCMILCRKRQSGRPHAPQQDRCGENERSGRMLSACHIVRPRVHLTLP